MCGVAGSHLGLLGLEGLVGRRSAVPRSDLRPHPPRLRSDRDGGRQTFHFVTEGIESAYEQAKAVAGGQNISIAGGASCAQQALKAGLVDEVDLQVSPVILGAGERLLDGFEPGEPELELVRVLEAPGTIHIRYRVVK